MSELVVAGLVKEPSCLIRVVDMILWRERDVLQRKYFRILFFCEMIIFIFFMCKVSFDKILREVSEFIQSLLFSFDTRTQKGWKMMYYDIEFQATQKEPHDSEIINPEEFSNIFIMWVFISRESIQ